MAPDSRLRLDPARLARDGVLPNACKAFGVALLAQCLLPWAPSTFFWSQLDEVRWLPMLWGFLAGGGLIALGYAPRDYVPRRLAPALGAALAFVGLIALSRLAGPHLVGGPFSGLLLGLGLATAAVALLLWRVRGHGPLPIAVTVTAVVLLALWTLAPLDGRVPLAYVLGLFGTSGVPNGWRWATALGFVLPLAFGALLTVFVIARRAEARPGWIRLLFWSAILLLPFVYLLVGLGAMRTSAWALVALLHHAIMALCFVALLPVAAGAFLAPEEVAAPEEARRTDVPTSLPAPGDGRRGPDTDRDAAEGVDPDDDEDFGDYRKSE